MHRLFDFLLKKDGRITRINAGDEFDAAGK